MFRVSNTHFIVVDRFMRPTPYGEDTPHLTVIINGVLDELKKQLSRPLRTPEPGPRTGRPQPVRPPQPENDSAVEPLREPADQSPT